MHFCFGSVYHSELSLPVLSCTAWELCPSYSLSYLRPRTRIYSPWCSYHLPQCLIHSNFSVNICWMNEWANWSQLVPVVSPLKGSPPIPTRPLPHSRRHFLFLIPALSHPLKVNSAIPGLCPAHREKVLRKQWNEDSLQELIEMWKLPKRETIPYWCFYHLNLSAIATKIWDSFVTLHHC